MNSRGGETFLFSKFIEGGKRVQAAPKFEVEGICSGLKRQNLVSGQETGVLLTSVLCLSIFPS